MFYEFDNIMKLLDSLHTVLTRNGSDYVLQANSLLPNSVLLDLIRGDLKTIIIPIPKFCEFCSIF